MEQDHDQQAKGHRGQAGGPRDDLTQADGDGREERRRRIGDNLSAPLDDEERRTLEEAEEHATPVDPIILARAGALDGCRRRYAEEGACRYINRLLVVADGIEFRGKHVWAYYGVDLSVYPDAITLTGGEHGDVTVLPAKDFLSGRELVAAALALAAWQAHHGDDLPRMPPHESADAGPAKRADEK